jgi:hypothetical protein
VGFSVYPVATNRVKEFTSSGTWVCPSGVYAADFLVVGAGGAGGGVGSSGLLNTCVGGGGGGGAVKKVTLSTTPGTSYTVTIGAKGTGTGAAAGGNGGFTEILNGATTLIRSFGGRGGAGINATLTVVSSTATGNVAGGGGQSTAPTSVTPTSGGGGGGALATTPFFATTYYDSPSTSTEGLLNVGLEGSYGKLKGTTGNIYYTLGTAGIDGYGGGGGGGFYDTNVSRNALPQSAAPYGAGAGAVLTAASTSAVGTAALANTGGGGGGAASDKLTTSRAGGDGADGLVRIVYFA